MKKKCYGCGKIHRRKSRFCTNKCAAIWAEIIAQGNGDSWCETCQEWAPYDPYKEHPHPLAPEEDAILATYTLS